MVVLALRRPFFDKITIDLPAPAQETPDGSTSRRLVIESAGAADRPYIKSLTVNGTPVQGPTISHAQLKDGGQIVFEMSEDPQPWNDNGGMSSFPATLVVPISLISCGF